jgi:hypothetical protein
MVSQSTKGILGKGSLRSITASRVQIMSFEESSQSVLAPN